MTKREREKLAQRLVDVMNSLLRIEEMTVNEEGRCTGLRAVVVPESGYYAVNASDEAFVLWQVVNELLPVGKVCVARTWHGWSIESEREWERGGSR